MRATRPSMPSSSAANTIAASARSSVVLDRQADRGEPGAQRQQRDEIGQQRAHRDRLEAAAPCGGAGSNGGKTMRSQYSPSRRKRATARLKQQFAAVRSSRCGTRARRRPPRKIGQHGFAGNRGLPDRDQRRRAVGQIDVEPRAEADHAEALAGRRPAGPRARSRRCAAPPGPRSAPPRRASPAVAITSELRSLSALALSRSALKNLPG